MARASIPTLLSLDRFAKLLGVSPPHFGGAAGSAVFPSMGSCHDVWPQHTWQSGEELASREEVAQAIADAEQDIKAVLGYSVAPTWEVDEMHTTNGTHSWDGGASSRGPITRTRWGKLIAPGVRAVTAVELGAPLVLSDPDGDQWQERVTITVATEVEDVRQLKLYFAGHDAAPEWEIRPVRRQEIVAGVATFEVDRWLLIDPDLWERYPTSPGLDPINLELPSNFVEEVDVYREYTDTSQPSARFTGPTLSNSFLCPACGGTGCATCTASSADGCFLIRDAERGLISAMPATFEAGAWLANRAVSCQRYEQARLYYYAGHLSPRYVQGQSMDPLDDYLAMAVAWLAICRIERPVCDCSNVKNTVERLRRDLTVSTRQEGFLVRFEKMDIFSCPFGTRLGEVRAWQRVSRIMGDQVFEGGAI